jgi:hypothetical protein
MRSSKICLCVAIRFAPIAAAVSAEDLCAGSAAALNYYARHNEEREP